MMSMINSQDDSQFFQAKARPESLRVLRSQLSLSKDDSEMQPPAKRMPLLESFKSDEDLKVAINAYIEVNSADEDGISACMDRTPACTDSDLLNLATCKADSTSVCSDNRSGFTAATGNGKSPLSTHNSNEWDSSDDIFAFEEEQLLTEAERNEFLAPLPMKASAAEFKPAMKLPTFDFVPNFDLAAAAEFVPEPELEEPEQPEYKIKEKTEICKYWLNGQECKFGDKCSFAHGDAERVKKVHVASKYRVTLCKKFLEAPHVCMYGRRCQFCHLQADFSDFDSQRTRYQNLLTENSRIMDMRMKIVADPDVNTFNIAMPEKRRLPIFEQIAASEDKKCCSKQSKQCKKKCASKKCKSEKAVAGH